MRVTGMVAMEAATRVVATWTTPSRGPRAAPMPAYDRQPSAFLTMRLDMDQRPAPPDTWPEVRLSHRVLEAGFLLVGPGQDGVLLDPHWRVLSHVSAFSPLGWPTGGTTAVAGPEWPGLGDVFVGTDASPQNWYHTLCFGLPKTAAAGRLVPGVEAVLPDMMGRGDAHASANWAASRAAFGVAETRRLAAGVYPVRRAHFVWTDPAQPTDWVMTAEAQATFDDARDRVVPEPAPDPARRLLVLRGAASRLDAAQVDAVRTAAARHGFVAFDPGVEPFERTARAFGAAEAVVGEHGAGLANMVFSRSVRVLELNMPLGHGPWLRPWYYQLAALRGFAFMHLNANAHEVTEAGVDGALRRLLG